MNPLLIGLLAGAGVGLGKHFLFDVPAYNRKKKRAAESNIFAGITGRSEAYPDEPNAFGTALGYAGTGAQLGQNYQMGDYYQKKAENEAMKNDMLKELVSPKPTANNYPEEDGWFTPQPGPGGVPYSPETIQAMRKSIWAKLLTS